MFWVEVLNRAIEWLDFDVVRAQAGAQVTAQEHGAIVGDAALLRAAFTRRYLAVEGPAGERDRLLQWLSSVTFRGGSLAVPVVARQRGHLPSPFEGCLSTALVQFLLLVDATAELAVHRCHGIRREAALDVGYPPECEPLFGRVAGLQDILTRTPARQCPRLIHSARGSRYCSKACSNAAFAALKGLADPEYFARKQARYRNRQRTASKRPRPSNAFVYIDR